MTFKNNARTQIVGNIGASDTSLIVSSSEGAIFPTSFPFKATLEHYVSGVVTKREIVSVTNIVGDIFTITRAQETCVQDDSASPKTRTNTAYSFSDGDYISQYVTEDDYNALNTFKDTTVPNTYATKDEVKKSELVYGASSEGTDAYAITVSGLTAYADGMMFRVKADVANTGAATLNVTSLGAKAIKKAQGTVDLDTGDIAANGIFVVVYNSTLDVFQYTSQVAVEFVGVLKTEANEFTKTQNFDATTLTDGANISWDLESNQVCSVTLAGNRTLDNPTNMVDGAIYHLIVKQDATGSRTLSYGDKYKFVGGVIPTLSAQPSNVDIIKFISDGTYMYGIADLSFIILGAIYGFFAGGSTGSDSNEIDGLENINTTTPSAINPSATLVLARLSMGALQNTDKGFYCSGTAGGARTSEIDGLDGTDTSAPTQINPSATLAVSRSGHGGMSASAANYGYCVCGFNATPVNVTEVDGLSSTDTTTPSAINPATVMAVAKRGICSVYSASKGYTLGGYTTGASTGIEGLDSINTSSPTQLNPSNTLTTLRYGAAGLNSESIGFCAGGYTGSVYSDDLEGVDNIDTTTLTSINPSAVLAVGRTDVTAVNSAQIGFCGGGTTGTVSSEIDGFSSIDTTTPSAIDPSATLTAARTTLRGVSNQ